MAADASKLKLLPRHLQRSQPAASGKSKRRVTVEDENAGDEESDRRSVFERLGPGGPQRNEKTKLEYVHGVKGRSKNDGEKSPDNLRLKFKGSKDKETKVRSQVVPLVVKKSGGAGSDDNSGGGDSDNWSIDNLEDKKERELLQKRQEIQRALKALEDGDDAPNTDTKQQSESSGSDSSPERPHKKKKEKSGKKKEKKKHKKVPSEKEMSVERLGKRKHGSDSEDASPHKKKKKKNKERKHGGEEPYPPPLMSLDTRKHPAPKSAKTEAELYEPESPTPSTPRAESPEAVKGKGKRKKKKMKSPVEAPLQGKSKKVLSPLKKVLKLKKGASSVTSSKLSRSASRESTRRKRSRSLSSSSSDSSSETPVRRRAGREPSPDERQERGRVKSKSLERKRKQAHPQQHTSPRHHHHQRSASSSSSSSSSTSSSSSSTTAKGGAHRHSRGRSSRVKATESQGTGSHHHHQHQHHQQQQQQKHKRSKSPAGSAGRKDARPNKRKRNASAESWNRSKDRKGGGGRGSETPQRQHRQGMGVSGGGADAGDRGRQRKRQQEEEGKGHRLGTQPSGRAVSDSRDRGGARQGMSKERQRRGAKVSRDRGRKEGRDGDKGDDRKDEPRDRLGGGVGGQAKDRDRSDDRGRRVGGAGGASGGQQADRGGRQLPRGGESGDRDRRNFGGGDSSSRTGQTGGRMGRDWEDRDTRRDGDWESGREGRSFGGLRDSGTREFGGGAGKRRDGKEDRLLPHLGGGGAGSAGLVRSGSQDMLQPRGGHGQREDYGGGQDGGRDRRGASQDGPGGKRDREGGRVARDESRGGRGGRDESGKPRGVSDRDAKSNETSASSRDRDGRETRDSKADRGKGHSSSGRGGGSDGRPSPAGQRGGGDGISGSRAVNKLRSEPTKEDSPGGMRGESSLAAVFDQTETTRSNSTASGKKKPTKTFGGKKSPKKTLDDAKRGEEKSKLGMGGRSLLASRNQRLGADRRGAASSGSEVGSARAPTSSRDSSLKDDGRSAIKKEIAPKDKASTGSQSPKGSHKSADSHHSHTRSSRRSSRSPSGRRDTSGGHQDSSSVTTTLVKSPRKKSRSPAPAPSSGGHHHHHHHQHQHQDKERDGAGTPASGSAAHGDMGRPRSKEDWRRGDTEKSKGGPDRGKRRGKSHTPSDSEAKPSPSTHERRRRKSSDSIESLPAKLDGGDIAAAMLGDGIEDGQDVFSDWSDDDDTFNTIIDVDPRKNQVEDLDNHGFEFGPRGHALDPRGRRGSPSMGQPGPHGMLLLGMAPPGHPANKMLDMGLSHRDLPPHMHHHHLHHHPLHPSHPHHGGPPAGHFHHDAGEMPMGVGGGGGVAGGAGLGEMMSGHGGQGGQVGGVRMDGDGRPHMDPLLSKPALEKNIPDVKIVEDVQKEKPARERRRRNTGEEGYEEISSDENDLDEEGEKAPKRTIVSILDIDMSSLMQATKPSQPPVSARKAVFHRYKACSVFSQLGLSRRFAGDALFSQVQEACQKQVEQEEQEGQEKGQEKDAKAAIDVVPPAVTEASESTKLPMDSNITTTSASDSGGQSEVSSTNMKQEVVSTEGSLSQSSVDTSFAVKSEVDADSEKPSSSASMRDMKVATSSTTTSGANSPAQSPSAVAGRPGTETYSKAAVPEAGQRGEAKRPEFRLYGDSPADHVLRKARAQERSGLLSSFGLFRRALTARKDLDIRRQLCRIDSKYDQSAIYPSGLLDPDMFRLSLQVLRQKKASVVAAATVG